MDELNSLKRRFDAGEFDPPLSLEERLRAAVDAGYYVVDAPSNTDIDAEPESPVNRWFPQRKG